MPHARAGQVIGLLGGSFDPAHAGHLMISREALRRFGLNRVWWMVSPGNPLKENSPAPVARRIAHARSMPLPPAIQVTDVEARLGTRYTAETLHALQARYPGVRFVWLMGADNLAQFDQWQSWRAIMNSVPIGVIARPGDRISARMSKAARFFRHARIPGRQSQALAYASAPAWCFINVPMSDASSTQLRRQNAWGA